MLKRNTYSINPETYVAIRKYIPEGSTILEFGSGLGTQYLSRHYNMISIESEKEWMNKYDSKYIYAPLVERRDLESKVWYEDSPVRAALQEEEYTVIIMDGPAHDILRSGIKGYIKLMRPELEWIVIDDVNCPEVYGTLHFYARTYDIEQLTVGGVQCRNKNWAMLKVKDPYFTFQVTPEDVERYANS